MNVYTIIFERSDDPCNAEIKTFATLKGAKDALYKHINAFVKNFPDRQDIRSDAWASFYENDGEAYAVTVEEGKEIFNRIEKQNVITAKSPRKQNVVK